MFDQIKGTTDVLRQALSGYSTRQQAISNNISNADTPGYQRLEVGFEQQMRTKLEGAQAASTVPMAITDPRHMPLTLDDMPFAPSVRAVHETTLRRDGNNVDIDAEMAKLAQNEISYNAATQFLAGRVTSLKYVIADGGNG